MKSLKQGLLDVAAIVFFAILAFAYFYPADVENRVLNQGDISAGIGAGEEASQYLKKTGERTRWTNSLFSGMPTYQIAPSYDSTDAVSVLEKAYHLWLPDQEPAVAPAAMHSLEHLMATWFRNSEVKDDVVYVGPMGCLTGMYIIMTGTYNVEDMRRLTIACLQWILTQTEVPATRPESCGNYLLHDLPMCKWESRRYLERLQHDFHSEYAKLQITLGDGRIFADA